MLLSLLCSRIDDIFGWHDRSLGPDLQRATAQRQVRIIFLGLLGTGPWSCGCATKPSLVVGDSGLTAVVSRLHAFISLALFVLIFRGSVAKTLSYVRSM